MNRLVIARIIFQSVNYLGRNRKPLTMASVALIANSITRPVASS